MKERPILFNGAMVRAILDGRKTQARAAVNQQSGIVSWKRPILVDWYEPIKYDSQGEMYPGKPVFGFCSDDDGWVSPFGAPGDRLWVRETWQMFEATVGDSDREAIWYRADLSNRVYKYNGGDRRLLKVKHRMDPVDLATFGSVQGVLDGSWRPSIHMPRWASRINLEVIDVRVERLQDITEEAAMAEGVQRMKLPSGYQAAGNNMLPMYKQSFAYQWDTSNKKRGFAWEVNPYVWVIEFTRI